MGIIYLIENQINGKKYVGLTTRNLQIRWKEHTRHYSQVIDKAIQVYGEKNFTIKQLEECPDEELDKRETYWIKYFNSANNGYNLTQGGRNENMVYNSVNFEKVGQLWKEGYGQKAIKDILGINVETVHNYLLKNGITEEDIKERHRQLIGKSKSKKIVQLDSNDNIIKIWDSITSIDKAGVSSRATVNRCLKDPKKISNGFKWKYYKSEDNV